jgi:hypothetical protein
MPGSVKLCNPSFCKRSTTLINTAVALACCAGGFNPQFFPTLGSVMALFSRPFTAASFLLHAAAINLIAARSAYLDGEDVHHVHMCMLY